VIEVLQTEHFRRWVDRLRDRSVRARILARIVAVEEGHFGDWKAIDRTVSELRVHAGPGYRVYFTRRGNTLVILLAGGDKQSQRRDIEMARRLAAELRDLEDPDQ
jgi:putative addiction module killer protein